MAKLVIKNVRFSYAHVWDPSSITEGGEQKYSVSCIVSKDDEKTIEAIEKAVKEAMEEGKAKFGGKIPKVLKLPLRDGDEEREDDPNYANSYFFNASSKNAPGIVDAKVNKIMDREEFYSGCYGNVSINFYAFNTSGNMGIAAGLGNLQKMKDGERLSGGSTAEQDFGVEDDDNLMG